MPSQSPHPGAHAHAPPVAHTWFARQVCPHDPQWAVVSSGVSQPLLATPSQSPYPAVHEQCEAPHASWEPQTTPQAPQFEGSLVVLVHVDPQSVPTHVLVQCPPLQIGALVPHDCAHVPQCDWVVSDDSHPFAREPSQLPHPGSHAHAPLEQVA